jgi:hypothetical protein
MSLHAREFHRAPAALQICPGLISLLHRKAETLLEKI